MKQLKRTLLTLVALLAVTTGAWAAGSDALAGVFTINASGDKVQFSKGNLQAVFSAAGTDCTWQFAENQWDCSGYGGGQGGNYLINGNGSVSAPGTVDLFGWSTSATKFGILRSSDNNDFSGDFVDWGVNIGEGWRTLSADEWKYLLDNHTYGFATVCGVKGIFVLPDGCSLTINTNHNNFDNNTIDAAEWASTYAPVGVLFLPAHGFLHGNDYNQHQIAAYYWSSTAAATDGQKYAILYSYQASPSRVYNESKIAFNASSCFSVRLVRKAGTAATPVPLNWDATAKTATLTNGMPAGNVTVSVEYFPQAEFAMSTDATPVALAPTAIADVPATTDGPIVTPGTVANIGTSEVKQGTLMYYVSQTPMTDAQLQALTPNQWRADVPTAADLLEGAAYVYYYIQGAEPAQGTERTDANTCSDGDILAANVVNVTVLSNKFDLTLKAANANTIDATDASKGSVTVKVGDAEAEDKTEDIADGKLKAIKMGSEVKLNTKAGYKFRKVEVKKAPIYTMAKDAATDDIGKLICTDGHIHAYGEDAECTKDRVAMIAYVGNASDCSHGLAIALKDESDKMNWVTAGTTCSGKTPTVTDGTWRLPSIMDWQYMLIGCGHNGTANANISNDSYMVATGLFAKLSAAGGDEFIYWIDGVQDANYWMSTENSGNTNQAWRMHFNSKDEAGFHNTTGKNENTINVRACLAF